jgi:hypothetical protein
MTILIGLLQKNHEGSTVAQSGPSVMTKTRYAYPDPLYADEKIRYSRADGNPGKSKNWMPVIKGMTTYFP